MSRSVDVAAFAMVQVCEANAAHDAPPRLRTNQEGVMLRLWNVFVFVAFWLPMMVLVTAGIWLFTRGDSRKRAID